MFGTYAHINNVAGSKAIGALSSQVEIAGHVQKKAQHISDRGHPIQTQMFVHFNALLSASKHAPCHSPTSTPVEEVRYERKDSWCGDSFVWIDKDRAVF